MKPPKDGIPSRLKNFPDVWRPGYRPEYPDVWHPGDYPEQRPRPAREQRNEQMTIAAGFLCKDGIVIGADTEMTYSAGLKTGESKVRTLITSDRSTTLLLTGAGHWNYVRMAIGKIASLWTEMGSQPLTPELTLQLLETVILEIFEKHIAAYPDPHNKPLMSLIAGLRTQEGRLQLFASEETAINLSFSFEIEGAGFMFGRYFSDILNRIPNAQGAMQWFPIDFSVADVCIWAAYMFWAAKKYVPGCGGQTQLDVIRQSGELVVLPVKFLKSLEKRFEKWEPLVFSLIAKVFSPGVSKDELAETMNTFSKEVARLRTGIPEFL